MRRARFLAPLLVPLVPVVQAGPATSIASAPAPASATTARAGAAVVDATWHVGSSAGQYASNGTALHNGDHVDPSAGTVRRQPSYGVQTRSTIRALVVEGGDGARFALVSNDLYIPQDLVNRRVAQLLAEHPSTGITERNLTISVSHSHSSPYYSTPSWGVWAFQDVFDIRFFEYQARRMAEAVVAAAADLRPARIGGATSPIDSLMRNSMGPERTDDGTPGGFPWGDSERTAQVIAVDDVSAPGTPSPLATWVVFGGHPEFLSGNDLLSGEYVNRMMTIVDREVGGVTLFSQNDTGTAEPHKEGDTDLPPERRHHYSHAEYAQMTRAARLLADVVADTRADIGRGTPAVAGEWAPFDANPTVAVSDVRFAPPSLRAVPMVSNCVARKAFAGNPPVPLAGLPDCEHPVQQATGGPGPFDPGVTYDRLREAGVPVPDNVGAPSVTGLQETIQVHVQAIRIGDIAVTVCPCEQWADQSRNIKSRINRVAGDRWDGFDWTALRTSAGRDWCVQHANTTWTCGDPHTMGATDLAPVSDLAYRRMLAEIHNDARGWDDPERSLEAESEPRHDPAAILGNYTHEELAEPATQGYSMVVPVSMSNDYFGYIATYREFQNHDHYRKALTGLGPHSSDFFATRLTRMAAALKDGGLPPVPYGPKDLAYEAEGARQRETARAVGVSADTAVAAYTAQLPANAGTPAIVEQPPSVARFEVAGVAWVGGDNYTDLPDVRVERLVDGAWVPYADQHGGVQALVHYPTVAELPAYRAGLHQWRWEATFEAFTSDIELPDASGVRRRSTPAGTYRFVIDGVRKGVGPVTTPYHLESAPFEVRPYAGITAGDLRQETDGSLSFTVSGLDYPDSDAGPFRFIRNERTRLRSGQVYCMRCSFEPWADRGSVVSAVVAIGGRGRAELVVATLGPDGRFRTAPMRLTPGRTAVVPAGGVVDDNGESNVVASNVVVGSVR